MKRGGEELQVHMWEEGRSGDEEIRRDNVIVGRERELTYVQYVRAYVLAYAG